MTAQESNALAVVEALDEAMNAGRLEEALALFSADAVVTFPGQTKPNQYRSTERIRSWLQSDISEGVQVEAYGRTADGERVRWEGRVSLATWREQGIGPIEGQAEAIVRDGRIVSFTYTLSPKSLAQLRRTDDT